MKKGDIIEEKCPKCGSDEGSRFVKAWNMTGRGNIKTLIQQFKCIACRKRWRRGLNVNKGAGGK